MNRSDHCIYHDSNFIWSEGFNINHGRQKSEQWCSSYILQIVMKNSTPGNQVNLQVIELVTLIAPVTTAIDGVLKNSFLFLVLQKITFDMS